MKTSTPQTVRSCNDCGRTTTKAISTAKSKYLCYSCYVKKANSERKTSHSREETRIQEEFFRKVPILLPNLPEKLLFAVPNGGSRNKAEAASLKRQGVKAGVADVILQMPGSGYGSLAIEFKAKTGRQSPSQIEFQKQTEKAGNKYVICKSAFDAIKAIMEYLNIRI